MPNATGAFSGFPEHVLIQIETADRRLLASVASTMEEAARKSGDWLVCRPGCTQCCMGAFEITALDALRLRNGLAQLAAVDEAKAERVRRRVAAHQEEEDAACPVLDPSTGLCDLYESRPMMCRVFGPATRVDGGLAACELCYQGASDEQIAACTVEVDPDGLEAEILQRLGDAQSTTVAAALR
jgi:Fe-S-cluster containining protein